MFSLSHNAKRWGLAALSLLLFVSVPAESQRMRRRNPMDGGHGGFQLGVMTLGLTDLNAALKAASYPELKQQFLSLGGAGFGERGRWLIGGEGAALVGNEPSTASGAYTLRATGAYGMFRIGYDFVASDAVDFYPTIGFGGGGVSFDIRGRSAPTFTDILTTPGRSSRMTSGGFVIGFGLNGNVRTQMTEEEDGSRAGMLVGFSIGYVLSPASSAWRLDEVNSVAGGPEFKIQGAYFRMTFGGWGKEPPKKK